MFRKNQTSLALAATFAALVLFAPNADGQEPILVIDSGGHSSVIKEVIFTRDGRRLISAGADKVVRVWNVESGQVERTILGEITEGDGGRIHAAALSPDEKILAVGGWLAEKADPVRLHDFETGEVFALLEGHKNVIYDLAFSPDGRFLASASSDNTVRLWDVGQRRELRVLAGHGDGVYGVAFSPDGKKLASASWDKKVRIWEVSSGELLGTFAEHQDQALRVAFSPDGRFLASGGGDGSLHLRSGQTGALLKELPRQSDRIETLSFSPDSKSLLAGGASLSAQLFALPGGEALARFAHNNVVFAGAFSPQGGLVASAGGHNHPIELWRAQDAGGVRTVAGDGRSVWSVGFSADGKRLAFGQSVAVQNLNHKGPLETTLQLVRNEHYDLGLGADIPAENDFTRALVQQGDLQLALAPGGSDATLQIRRGGQVSREISRDSTSGYGHTSFTLSRDGRQLLSGAGGGRLTLYDSTSGAELRDFVGHTGDVWAVAVSADHRLVASGSGDQTVRLWSLASGQLLVSFFLGKDREWVAWTPKGYYTASARGDRYIGWHVNHGVDKAAEYFPVGHFQQQYYRPDVVNLTLELLNPELAITEANRRRGLTTVTEKAPEMPPQVVVVAPKDGERTSRKNFKIVAVATSSFSPLTELKVTRNGQIVNAFKGGLKGNPQLQRTEELEIELVPGPNVLTFTAATERSRSVTETRTVFYDAPADSQPSASRPSLAVLAVGISDYHDLGLRLQYADDDARDIASLFKSQEGKAFSRVSTQVLDGKTPVTREALLNALRWLKNEAPGKNSIRLLFLSGHGELDSAGNYYFLAQDHDRSADHEIKSLSWQVLINKLVEGEITNSILIVDTCHAAAARGGQRANVNLTSQLKVRENLLTFSSSSEEQSSIEGQGHGVFTEALLEGLRTLKADGRGGRPKDGIVEAVELGAWLSEAVTSKTDGRQRPSFLPAPGQDVLPLFREKP